MTGRKVAPPFVAAVINDNVVLRCALTAGGVVLTSEVAELKRPERVPEGTTSQMLRCMIYSPNLCVEDFPTYSWDANVEVDGVSQHVGVIERRCDVQHMQWMVPVNARRIQLRLHRLRQVTVRSKGSDLLADKVVGLLRDEHFNPRFASLPLQVVAEEAQRRFPTEYRTIGQDHCGSFRQFLINHDTAFALFHFTDKEIVSRKLGANVTTQDERVALKKGAKENYPPMLCPGHQNEAIVLGLLKDTLRESDSHVHRLLRTLSRHEVFRVSMSAAFSSLMHWLQRHKSIFKWTTDPRQVCTIGLIRLPNRPQEPAIQDQKRRESEEHHQTELPMGVDQQAAAQGNTDEKANTKGYGFHCV